MAVQSILLDPVSTESSSAAKILAGVRRDLDRLGRLL